MVWLGAFIWMLAYKEKQRIKFTVYCLRFTVSGFDATHRACYAMAKPKQAWSLRMA